MSIVSKHQASLFFVALSTGTTALACSPGQYDSGGGVCVNAPLGSYVPNAGMTAAILAPPGRYVDTVGAISAQLANPGTYVNIAGATIALPTPLGTFAPFSGMTAPVLAPLGYYIPITGATSATPVTSGFYTPRAGSINQVPAGGMAAPLTTALQAQTVFNDLSADLMDSQESPALKVATAYQKAEINQEGLASGNFNIDTSALVFQADFLKSREGAAGVQFAAGQHRLKNGSEVGNTSHSYQFSAFSSGNLLDGKYQAQLLYGQNRGENRRNIIVSTNTTTNNEVLTNNDPITWFGVQSKFKYPIKDEWKFLTQLGAISYNVNAITETGSATNSGGNTPALGGSEYR